MESLSLDFFLFAIHFFCVSYCFDLGSANCETIVYVECPRVKGAAWTNALFFVVFWFFSIRDLETGESIVRRANKGCVVSVEGRVIKNNIWGLAGTPGWADIYLESSRVELSRMGSGLISHLRINTFAHAHTSTLPLPLRSLRQTQAHGHGTKWPPRSYIYIFAHISSISGGPSTPLLDGSIFGRLRKTLDNKILGESLLLWTMFIVVL